MHTSEHGVAQTQASEADVMNINNGDFQFTFLTMFECQQRTFSPGRGDPGWSGGGGGICVTSFSHVFVMLKKTGSDLPHKSE